MKYSLRVTIHVWYDGSNEKQVVVVINAVIKIAV
jgi:hypothetical protein